MLIQWSRKGGPVALPMFTEGRAWPHVLDLNDVAKEFIGRNEKNELLYKFLELLVYNSVVP